MAEKYKGIGRKIEVNPSRDSINVYLLSRGFYRPFGKEDEVAFSIDLKKGRDAAQRRIIRKILLEHFVESSKMLAEGERDEGFGPLINNPRVRRIYL